MRQREIICIDIETQGQSPDKMADLMPRFEAPANYKDPEKVKVSIAEQQAKWTSEAALHAERGQILCIGVLKGDSFSVHEGPEPNMLSAAWETVKRVQAGALIIGHNLIGFDLPFMVRRSWALGVPVPRFVVDDLGKYRQPGWAFDTMLAWSFQNRQERISLDLMAKHCGVGAKNGNGKDFGVLYRADHDKAMEYLANDLRLTLGIYRKITKTEDAPL